MQTFNIGRDYDKPIAIGEKSTSVSHDHASITIDDNGVWTLRDHDSTNGTYVENNGTFVRCSKVTVTPSTWIRLGDKGDRGHYFMARRVFSPNNYYDDFIEIEEQFKELEASKQKLDDTRRIVKFLTPALMILGLAVSMIPAIQNNSIAIRASFMLPGFVSPFIQDLLLNKLEKKVRNMQKGLICPKCRKPLSTYEINKRTCLTCKIN